MRRVSKLVTSMRTIAYIAPELTTAAEASVYQEFYALEGLGYRMLPFAVRRPRQPAREAHDIACRTVVLRQGGRIMRTLRSLKALPGLRARALPSLRLLMADMGRVGWLDGRAWTLPGHWLAAVRMAQHLDASRCNHIHAHDVSAPGQIAMYASAMTGVPYTCTAHAHDIFRHGLLLAEKARRARRMLTISHYNRSYLIEHGVDPGRIDVVRCSPDLTLASPGPAATRRTAYRIGTLGPLVDRRGVDDLIHALALLVRNGCPPIKLQVAGEGPERLRLQALAEELGLARLVDFIGALPQGGVAAWMCSLDLFATANRSDRHGDVDGIPVVLMEAMALGVPVVATRISGIPELVVHGKTGLLAEPADPASLADRITAAMVEPDRAQARGRAARAHVRWEFGRGVNLRRLVRCFEDASAIEDLPQRLEKAA